MQPTYLRSTPTFLKTECTNSQSVDFPQHARIAASTPLPGLLHPLRPRDIRAFLRTLGPNSEYGLRMIRLRSECLLHPSGMVFGEYVVPGEIHLYAVPASPWRLPFVPCPADQQAFLNYGAVVDVNAALRRTTVTWQPDSLKAFLLHEVLAHELGHHILQHNKGKRTAPICRCADHEAWADWYSRRTKGKTAYGASSL